MRDLAMVAAAQPGEEQFRPPITMVRTNFHRALLLLLTEMPDAVRQWRTVGPMSRRLGISQSHLQHLIRQELGCTYLELIRAFRMELVLDYLIGSPAMTIKEVAARCGYNDPQALYRDCKRQFGVSARLLRAMDRGAIEIRAGSLVDPRAYAARVRRELEEEAQRELERWSRVFPGAAGGSSANGPAAESAAAGRCVRLKP